MKRLMLLAAAVVLAAACTKTDENAHKTTEWYMEHRDVLTQDLERCAQISLKNQENWCAAADLANRKIRAQRVRDGMYKRAFP